MLFRSTGNNPANTLVTAADEIAVRNNPRSFLHPAAVDNVHDFNHDGFVSAADQIIARNNATSPASALVLLSAPAAAPLPADAQAIALALAIDDLHDVADQKEEEGFFWFKR